MAVSIFRVPRRLYWTADKSRLVEHGDPSAATLAFPVGHELSVDEARRFGFLEPAAPVVPVVGHELSADEVAVEKRREIARNKMRDRHEDKTAVVQQTITETTVVKEKP